MHASASSCSARSGRCRRRRPRRPAGPALRARGRGVDAAGGAQRGLRSGAGARRHGARRRFHGACDRVRLTRPRSSASWHRSSGHARRRPRWVASSTPCRRPAAPRRRGGARPRSTAWRKARGRRSARGTLAGARAALLVLHEDPAAEVRAGALGLLQLAGSADDATWRAAVRRAVAAAEQETDAHRRAERHRAGRAGSPGRCARTG